ncbi:hypothetical protein ASZ90_000395 [hydrocarbon metagenome]|uniref:Uncharacterized protein n=1 Tax=hydrocarbon metagenome TaxID=938273 RepID=A0A0W8G9A8_9ZZZZ
MRLHGRGDSRPRAAPLDRFCECGRQGGTMDKKTAGRPAVGKEEDRASAISPGPAACS